jgi:hypothetical protein
LSVRNAGNGQRRPLRSSLMESLARVIGFAVVRCDAGYTMQRTSERSSDAPGGLAGKSGEPKTTRRRRPSRSRRRRRPASIHAGRRFVCGSRREAIHRVIILNGRAFSADSLFDPFQKVGIVHPGPASRGDILSDTDREGKGKEQPCARS